VIDWNGDGAAEETFYAPLTTHLRHRFDTPGNYSVRATVTDFAGQAKSVVQPIAVQTAGPVASASVSVFEVARHAAENVRAASLSDHERTAQPQAPATPADSNALATALTVHPSSGLVTNEYMPPEEGMPPTDELDTAAVDLMLSLSQHWLRSPLADM
jgi:hypothetical protein